MIAIKGMDMPKSCSSCPKFNTYDTYMRAYCGHKEDYISFNSQQECEEHRHPNCPLIDLPEENKDMSWEELKEKCSNSCEISFDYTKNRLHFSKFNLSFNANGEMYLAFGNTDIYITLRNKIKPYQMYQIIKALGDQK